MDLLLHLRIYGDHPLVEIRVVKHQYLRVPLIQKSVKIAVAISLLETYSGSNKESIHAASDRRRENLADLQADEEGEGHDYGCV